MLVYQRVDGGCYILVVETAIEGKLLSVPEEEMFEVLHQGASSLLKRHRSPALSQRVVGWKDLSLAAALLPSRWWINSIPNGNTLLLAWKLPGNSGCLDVFSNGGKGFQTFGVTLLMSDPTHVDVKHPTGLWSLVLRREMWFWHAAAEFRLKWL